ncbi:hypothetical protein [Pantoea sp. At-9b]|uniref:hypothetical protein n=1 Tax=Pantoea sp. (strain At-9b) TaxID=592316 RepID=UPI0001B4075C|nr:hypothetical protein [Pantoea sp. At-9b]
MMRINFWFAILLLLLSSHFASASVSLLQPKSLAYQKNIIAEAEHSGLSRVELDKSQTFDVVKDGKLQGTLIQGKGWVREVQPVCFIGWSKDGENINQFIQTIGQGDWETVGCHKVDSVGFISKKDDENEKIAVIYTIEAPDHYGTDYYVMGLKAGDGVYYDNSTTEKFQNSSLKTIAELRKAYQK